MKYISRSLDDTKRIAADFVSALRPQPDAVVVALFGDLGAGKTAFSQAIGETLGVRESVLSPTFLIEKIYELHKRPWQYLVHIDAYRLDDESELAALGWEAIASRPENLILVEWADKIPTLLPKSAIRVTINGVDETTREIDINDQKE